MKTSYIVSVRKLKEKDNLEDIGIFTDAKIILK
jgi:hypothetical protein